jgi:NAD(P)-dependent dehydrogenase (short-subunit alcohol dehydrogenase family)
MKPILITGGARRLGAAMARTLRDAGYDVIIHAHHSVDEAQALAAEIGARVVLGDLAEPARILEQCGPLGGLINNASRFEFDTIRTVTAAELAAHYVPNVIAPVLLAQGFAAQQPEDGVIINILDQKLSNLNPDHFSYTLSKAALAAASEMMAQALAPNIRVCAIAPGITLPGARQSQERFARAWAANPLKRGATPEDIAATALYILRTPSLTGVTIPVDGGEHLTHRARDVAFLAPE